MQFSKPKICSQNQRLLRLILTLKLSSVNQRFGLLNFWFTELYSNWRKGDWRVEERTALNKQMNCCLEPFKGWVGLGWDCDSWVLPLSWEYALALKFTLRTLPSPMDRLIHSRKYSSGVNRNSIARYNQSSIAYKIYIIL